MSGCKALHKTGGMEDYKKEGVQYGVIRGLFLGRWWDFYIRGRSFADGKFWQEAENDLRQALATRMKDARRARTYGAHFIQYFGNRELGIALFKQGRMEEAIPYLWKSLEDVPTEKAEFYLRLCYRDLSKTDVDNENPEISLDAYRTITNDSDLTFSGTVKDNYFVDRLTINGSEIRPILGKTQSLFKHFTRLEPGENTFEIIATDAFGNSSLPKHVRVTLDREAPVISIKKATLEKVALSVINENEVRIENEKLENVNVLTSQASNIFEFAPINPEKALYVEFTDAANNSNGIRIQPEDLTISQSGKRRDHINDKFQRSPILLASSKLSKGLLSFDKSTADILQPKIEIQKLENLKNVYQDYVIISGRIRGTFKDFQINNQTKIREASNVRFSFKHDLELGKKNVIILKVSDRKGNPCEDCTKKFEITRHPGPEEIRDFRAATVLCPLAKEGGDREVSKNLLWDLLLELKQNGRFKILAADEEIQRVVEKERHLGEEGWIDRTSAAKFGKALNAEYSIACTIRPTQDDVEIYARLIDVETKETLASCDVYEYSENAKDFESAYYRFVEELGQNFPVVGDKIEQSFEEGAWGNFIKSLTVFSKEGKFVLEMGRDANVKEGMKFVAYNRDDPLIDFETGEILVNGKVNKVGELVAKIVTENATHLEPTQRIKIAKARYVVSK